MITMMSANPLQVISDSSHFTVYYCYIYNSYDHSIIYMHN